MSLVCAVQDAEGNALLRALPLEATVHIRANARKLQLTAGRVVHGPGQSPSFVYFPTTCVVSHFYSTSEGLSASMALTGSDGMIGLAVLLGAQNSAHGSIVQIGGEALRVAAPVVQAEFARAGLFQQLLLRYTQAFITQLAQTAACNRLHPLEQRLCRCLLLCHDRMGSNEMLMTQESMANMVGGRRESVTLAAGHLQNLGAIQYTRGHIRVLNRLTLEALVCECYATVVGEFRRLAICPTHEMRKPARSTQTQSTAGLGHSLPLCKPEQRCC